MTKFSERIISLKSIKLNIVEQGKGPLIVLCHGFPESWYSWRHQIPVLVEAGYRVVAADQRGYGKSDRPPAIADYAVSRLAEDMVELVEALGEKTAAIVGHDWGAPVAWNASLSRPDIFKAIVLLSVPFVQRKRGLIAPMQFAKLYALFTGKVFYQLYFQKPGVAEKEFEANIRNSLATALYAASGSPPPEHRWHPFLKKGQTFTSAHTVPKPLPSWLKEEDLDFYTKQFELSGFRGPLNWYRNVDNNWRKGKKFLNAKLRQPTLFISGDKDAVATRMLKKPYAELEETVPNLSRKVLLPGVGHWVQQENPTDTNKLLLEFLKKAFPAPKT